MATDDQFVLYKGKPLLILAAAALLILGSLLFLSAVLYYIAQSRVWLTILAVIGLAPLVWRLVRMAIFR